MEPVFRLLQRLLQAGHLLPELVFPLTAVVFQLQVDQSLAAFVALLLIHPLDLIHDFLNGGGIDPLGQQLIQPPYDHRRQGTQGFADLLGLFHQHIEHPVFFAVGQHEVMAEHLGGALKRAVDAAVALLHAPGVPRHVEVEEVPAVVLQVHPLAGGIGGDQDAQRVQLRRAVEAALEGFPFLIADAAVEGGDALLFPLAAGNQ